MISHFYLHISIGHFNPIDARVTGWREVGTEAETAVHIERIVVDGNITSEAYTQHLLKTYPSFYREIERKLGLPCYSLRYTGVEK